MASKTICDTMIWYYFGNGKLDRKVYENETLAVTFINVHEVATTFNLLNVVDEVRSAIQQMMTLPKTTLFDPPLIHLARLANSKFDYDSFAENDSIFNATQLIAKGHEIEPAKRPDFLKWLEEHEKPVEEFASFTNEKIDEIRKRITDKKKHAAEDATQGNRQFVSTLVQMSTEGKYNLDNLDWSRVELFERTLSSFFKELELSGNMRFQPNDLFDLLNLVYVEPGDRYFTMEKRWNNRIRNAGLEHYIR